MCGPRASGITPYGCSSVTVLYMSQPLSASHCLVYLRIPQHNLTSGFGSISSLYSFVFRFGLSYLLLSLREVVCLSTRRRLCKRSFFITRILGHLSRENTMEQIQHLYGGQDN